MKTKIHEIAQRTHMAASARSAAAALEKLRDGQLCDGHDHGVQEEDEPDFALAHAGLILREHRQELDLRITRRDEHDRSGPPIRGRRGFGARRDSRPRGTSGSATAISGSGTKKSIR
jgi:hypothetical protein